MACRSAADGRSKLARIHSLFSTGLISHRQRSCSASKVPRRKAKFNHICPSLLDHLCQEGDNPDITQLRSLADLKNLWELAWYVLVSKVVRAQSLRRLLRPLLITFVGTAFAGVAVWWSVAGTVAVSSSFASDSSYLPKLQFYSVDRKPAQLSEKNASRGQGAEARCCNGATDHGREL